MKNNPKTFPKCEHLTWGNSNPQQVLENNEKLMRFRGKAIAWEMALRRELEQLKQYANKLMEDKDITRFARERGCLSLADGKVTIPIDEILGKTHEETV